MSGRWRLLPRYRPMALIGGMARLAAHALDRAATSAAQSVQEAAQPSWLPAGVELPSPSDPPDAPLTPAVIGAPDGSVFTPAAIGSPDGSVFTPAWAGETD